MVRGNLLLMHGSGDDNVHYQNSEVVINELVAQRKALHSMRMEMQPAMMAHMMHHMDMHGTKGAMECPMMKSDSSAPKAEDQKSKM